MTNRFTVIGAGLAFLVLLAAEACETHNRPAVPVTITFADSTWWASRQRPSHQLLQFTQETGIQVEPIMSGGEPRVVQRILEQESSRADVYGFDATWPGMFAEQFIDLKPYVPASEIAMHFPTLIANCTVGGVLVCLPRVAMVPLLWYRGDLLQQHGYRAPPRTWNELEQMAARIQAGERAKGRTDFWGFVWAGARSMPLATVALEWQASEGGGTIVENGRVTVNNAAAVASWERAAGWIGSISPPAVLEYMEPDVYNVWSSSNTAFARTWPFESAFDRRELPKESVGVAPLPKGAIRRAATLGRYSFGVSRRSPHPREAAMLVRFLSRRDVQLEYAREFHVPPSIIDLYDDPTLVAANPHFVAVRETLVDGVVMRPSAETGKAYPEVARAYVDAVHGVLAREQRASEAAANLQNVLRRVTDPKSVVRK